VPKINIIVEIGDIFLALCLW